VSATDKHDDGAGIKDIVIVRADRYSYCVENTAGAAMYHKDGPSNNIFPGRCP
jgi:hypothetical protein